MLPSRPIAAATAVLGLASMAVVRGERQPSAAPVPAAAIPAFRQANTVAVLTIDGPIDGITLHSLEHRVKTAKDRGAEAIVLDINTPGGELPATLDITHLIRNDMPANTVAWINPAAYSAGTIIALACREIVERGGWNSFLFVYLPFIALVLALWWVRSLSRERDRAAQQE